MLASLIQHNDDLPGKQQCLQLLSKLQLTEPALTARGSAFEHIYVKDYLQKKIQLGFPSPW